MPLESLHGSFATCAISRRPHSRECILSDVYILNGNDLFPFCLARHHFLGLYCATSGRWYLMQAVRATSEHARLHSVCAIHLRIVPLLMTLCLPLLAELKFQLMRSQCPWANVVYDPNLPITSSIVLFEWRHGTQLT